MSRLALGLAFAVSCASGNYTAQVRVSTCAVSGPCKSMFTASVPYKTEPTPRQLHGDVVAPLCEELRSSGVVHVVVESTVTSSDSDGTEKQIGGLSVVRGPLDRFCPDKSSNSSSR